MRIMRAGLASVVALCAVISPASAFWERPLIDLAGRIPADAESLIYLADFDAVRRDLADRLRSVPDLEAQAIPMGHIPVGGAFDLSSAFFLENQGQEALGFRTFDIDRFAAWGDPPEAPMIVGVDVDAAALGPALEARGYETRDLDGVTVWHRQEDFEIDFERIAEDPFTGRLGTSGRFALVDGVLLFSRGWAQMERLLDDGPSLMDDADAAAILKAAYRMRDRGRLAGALLHGPQPARLDPAALLGLQASEAELDALRQQLGLDDNRQTALPPFRRYAILFWQKDETLSGALAIAFPSEGIADLARSRFEALLDGSMSYVSRRPMAEILPYERDFRIVEANGRSVLLLIFVEKVDLSLGVNVTTFLGNPSLRLHDMLLTRDLDALIGFE